MESAENLPSIWDRIAGRDALVVLLKPDDMKRLYSDGRGSSQCPWPAWAICRLPSSPAMDALPRPQDAQIFVTRDSAEIAPRIAGQLVVTFDRPGLDGFDQSASEWLFLSDIAVPPYRPFGDPLHLILTVNRRTADRHPREVDQLTAHDMVRMMATAASSILVEQHRRRAGNEIAAPIESFFISPGEPSRTNLEIELAGGTAVRRLAGTEDAPKYHALTLERPLPAIGIDPDAETALASCHAVSQKLDVKTVLGIFLPDIQGPYRRPSIGARLALTGIAPAWKGRRILATAMHLSRGLLTIELAADGELLLTGWHQYAESISHDTHSAYVAELRPVSAQADRLLSFADLREKPLEEIRRLLIEAFVREINPRLPMPFRLAFANQHFGAHDDSEWKTVETVISDAVAADPELSQAAPIRYAVILPQDPKMARPRIYRRNVNWLGDKPSTEATHRFLLIANAAIQDMTSWGFEAGWADHARPSLTLWTETQQPQDVLGTAEPAPSSHTAITAAERTAAFWRAARTMLPVDSWIRCMPDGLPISPKAVATLDEMYL